MLITLVMTVALVIAIGGVTWLGLSFAVKGTFRNLAASAAIVVLPPVLAWFATTAYIRQDGPFTGVRCDLDRAAGQAIVSIDADGFSARGCVDAYVTQTTFANKDERRSFHLCVGRDGVCFDDSGIPAVLRGGAHLEPGSTKTLDFPPRDLWSAPFERCFPMTLEGAERPANDDLVVRTTYYQGWE